MELLSLADLNAIRTALIYNFDRYFSQEMIPHTFHELAFLYQHVGLFAGAQLSDRGILYSYYDALNLIFHHLFNAYIDSDYFSPEMKCMQFFHYLLGTNISTLSQNDFVHRGIVLFREKHDALFRSTLESLVLGWNRFSIGDDLSQNVSKVFDTYFKFYGAEEGFQFIQSIMTQLFTVDQFGNIAFTSPSFFARSEVARTRFQALYMSYFSRDSQEVYQLFKYLIKEQIQSEMCAGFYAGESLSDKLKRVGANIAEQVALPVDPQLITTACFKLGEELRAAYPDESLNFKQLHELFDQSVTAVEKNMFSQERRYVLFGAVDFLKRIVNQLEENPQATSLHIMHYLQGDFTEYFSVFVEAVAYLMHIHASDDNERVRNALEYEFNQLAPYFPEDFQPQLHIQQYEQSSPYTLTTLTAVEKTALSNYFTFTRGRNTNSEYTAEHNEYVALYPSERHILFIQASARFSASSETDFAVFFKKHYPHLVNSSKPSSLYELNTTLFILKDRCHPTLRSYLINGYIQNAGISLSEKLFAVLVDINSVEDQFHTDLCQAIFPHMYQLYTTDVTSVLAELLVQSLTGREIMGIASDQMLPMICQLLGTHFNAFLGYFLGRHFVVNQDGEYVWTFINGRDDSRKLVYTFCDVFEKHAVGRSAIVGMFSVFVVQLVTAQFVEDDSFSDISEDHLKSLIYEACDYFSEEFPQIQSMREGVANSARRNLLTNNGAMSIAIILQKREQHELYLQRLYPLEKFPVKQECMYRELWDIFFDQTADYFGVLLAFVLNPSQIVGQIADQLRPLLHRFLALHISSLDLADRERFYCALITYDRLLVKEQGTSLLALLKGDCDAISVAYNQLPDESGFNFFAQLEEYYSLSDQYNRQTEYDLAEIIAKMTRFQSYLNEIVNSENPGPPDEYSGGQVIIYIQQRLARAAQHTTDWSRQRLQRYLRESAEQLVSQTHHMRIETDLGNAFGTFNMCVRQHNFSGLDIERSQELFERILAESLCQHRSKDMIIAQASLAFMHVLHLPATVTDFVESNSFSYIVLDAIAKNQPDSFDQACAHVIRRVLNDSVVSLEKLFELFVTFRSESVLLKVCKQYLFSRQCTLLHPASQGGKERINALFSALNTSQYDFSSVIQHGVRHVLSLQLA